MAQAVSVLGIRRAHVPVADVRQVALDVARGAGTSRRREAHVVGHGERWWPIAWVWAGEIGARRETGQDTKRRVSPEQWGAVASFDLVPLVAAAVEVIKGGEGAK